MGDRAKDGFYDHPLALKVPPGLTAKVLLSIEDVTSRVKGTVAGDGTAAIAKIEKECTESHQGDQCSVVKLFSGGRYDLYHYKTYSDLRLVFAPESQLAFFDAERDSITYLRYGLDAAFLRAYENGKPGGYAALFEVEHGRSEGRRSGFRSGQSGADHAVYDGGSTDVLSRHSAAFDPESFDDAHSTVDGVRRERGRAYFDLSPDRLQACGGKGHRTARRQIGGCGRRFSRRKFAHTVERDPSLGMAGGKVWDEVATAYKSWVPFERPYQILEGSPAPGSSLFRVARQIVRSEPVDADVSVNEPQEILMIKSYLDELQKLGEKESPIKNILGGKTTQQAAEEFVKTSKSWESRRSGRTMRKTG